MQNYAKFRKYMVIYANCYLKLWPSDAKLWPDFENLLTLAVDMAKSWKNWSSLQNYAKL